MSNNRFKKLSVHVTFELNVPVTKAQLVAAILRASNTPAFGIPGKVTVDMVLPESEVEQ